MKLKLRLTSLFLTACFAVSSCQTQNAYTGQSQMSKTAVGSIAGGLLGAGIGSLTGKGSTDRRQKAMIGAGIGALAGAGIGQYMDRQEAELRRELQGTGVGVSRQGNRIDLIMPGDITFATGSSTISAEFYDTLGSVSKVVNKFNKTLVDVTGHTDNVGERNYNFRLSESRARSVAGFLQQRGVNGNRFRIGAMGPDSPVATNSTADGRQANRRVTINLTPLTR